MERASTISTGTFSANVYPFAEKLTLFAFDFLAIAIGFYAGTGLSQVGALAHVGPRLSNWLATGIGSHVVCYICSVALLFYWFWERGHYSRRFPFWDEQRRLIKLTLSAAVAEAALLILLSEAPLARREFVSTWFLVGLFIIAGRILAKLFLLKVGVWKRPTVIVGVGSNAKLAYEALTEEKLLAYPVVAFACLSEAERPAGDTLDVFGHRFPVVVLGEQPDALLRGLGCQNVVVATDVLDVHANLIHSLSMSGRNVIVIPSISGLPLHGVEVSHFFSHETLMLSVRNNLGRKGAQIIKRIFDIVMSLFLLVVLSPLFIFVASRIRRESGPPSIFSQERVGRRGDAFRFLKFRSMVLDAEEILTRWRSERPDLWDEYRRNNFKLRNDPRMLKVGQWIRQTSIDELPQLLNVLRGEMSLVGPRPLLARELGAYGVTIDLYKQVRPGITGLWQISGRSQTKFIDRAAYDAWYVRNWSLWYDFVILLRTVKVVFAREGAY